MQRWSRLQQPACVWHALPVGEQPGGLVAQTGWPCSFAGQKPLPPGLAARSSAPPPGRSASRRCPRQLSPRCPPCPPRCHCCRPRRWPHSPGGLAHGARTRTTRPTGRCSPCPRVTARAAARMDGRAHHGNKKKVRRIKLHDRTSYRRTRSPEPVTETPGARFVDGDHERVYPTHSQSPSSSSSSSESSSSSFSLGGCPCLREETANRAGADGGALGCPGSSKPGRGS